MSSLDTKVNTDNIDENSKMMGQYFTPRKNVAESSGKNNNDECPELVSENVEIINIIRIPSGLFTNTQPKTICIHLEGDKLILKLL
jgi:hypothetical protein